MNPDLLVECQEMPFPSWMSRDTRVKVRASFLSLPVCDDDNEESGLVLLPPTNDIGIAMCTTSKRMAKAFKTVIGETCGTPPVENIEHFQDFLEEQEDQKERGF